MDAVDADVSKVDCFFFSMLSIGLLCRRRPLQPHRLHSPPQTTTSTSTTTLQCFELERLINRELRELRAAAERAQASTSAWAASLAPLDDALRALGDSESFFGAAAREVEGVAAALAREATGKEVREQDEEEKEEGPSEKR